MKSIRNYIALFLLLVTFTGCEDFFEPNLHNTLSGETVFNYQLNPEYVHGLYVPAYSSIPGSYTTMNSNFLDCATDNAVSNDYDSAPWKMYTIPEYFTSNNYPFYTWGNNYERIKNVYQFLTVGLNDDIVYYTSSEESDRQIRKRIEGEVHFLLALNYFQLLRDYAGPVNGTIMGVPIVEGEISLEEGRQIKRDSYADCVDFITAHIDTALTPGFLLPEYSKDFVDNNPDYISDVYGPDLDGLPTTTACYSLKSRMLLYAASPAFSGGDGNTELYRKAAVAAKEAIDILGGLKSEYYNPSNIDDAFFTAVDDNDELILKKNVKRIAYNNNSDWEMNNYPPSQGLAVKGRTNPSQNLVDAFPAANGYPIDHAMSGYDPLEDGFNPYANRDPRLDMTVIYNNYWFQNNQIQMWPGGNNTIEGNTTITNDQRISRTNYYLRKWITQNASFSPGIAEELTWHFVAMFRAVEVYLNFAEAANAAVGPDVAINGLTAREALRAVRHRANLPVGSGADVADDPYLAGLSDITEVIKAERRIELCFEGHRYYDIRRWNDNLNMPVKKVVITGDASESKYDFSEGAYPGQVELLEYMRYGAIPQSEILTCPNLMQNDGWR
ncbi:RagB/SusD family nutrient uptake outer membrane protein [Labilibacter marinus]|uniref:RagB/SusD family nutrient uptake outer membrane protein n=1 Tax=Labilibacter marinus TaxID=1477105 RepID=UPI00082BC2FC|nr:RagB/SusD family nutrient uptake outer membrane protein [Labilibacter marinus]